MLTKMLRAATPKGTAALELTHQANSISTSNNTTYTFSSLSLGTAFTGRRIVVVVISFLGSNSTRSINSVSVAGISATQRAYNVVGVATRAIIGIYDCTVDSGTTGNIVVTHNNSMDSCAVSVYSLANANTLSYPTAVESITDSSGDYSTTLSVQAGDVSVFGTRLQSTGGGTAAYSSPFVVYFNSLIESGSTGGSSAGAEFTTTNSSYSFSFTSTSTIPLPIVGVVIRNS